MGVAIAAPVGPIGVLCIRQTLTYGFLTGLVSGLGAATADGIYGSIAGFGISAISDLLVTQKHLLKIVGGLFLCYLGVKTFLITTKSTISSATDNTDHTQSNPHRHTLIQAYGTTLGLTLTNPATILSFTAIFAGMGMTNYGDDYRSALVLIVGVFCGSALWWLTLSSSIACFRDRFSRQSMKWINRLSGVIITSFGIIALLA
ncbi:LysE/ArgO family amino acid transporter [Okeania sp. SIO2G5]|uniref:LysE/ArgO family amino acid transporter n=1 Tax=Okeania sp. SIO2G5 TaxID=2607796 RepID=UPI00257B318F|nr:LysE family transporter [Okeania sp. SIO2G5]